MTKVDKKNIEDILSLTPMQEGMLYHYLKDPGSLHYFEQLSLEISGEIDCRLFEKAWNFVVDTNEMLRVIFRWEKMKHPTQVVLKKHSITPLYHDFSNMDRGEKEKLKQEVKINDRKKKFDLREVPWRITLAKMAKNRYEMIISNHHILYDGWSNGIILKEFFKAYNDLSVGKKLLKPVKTRFREFVKWNRDLDLDGQEKFWRNYLKGFDTPTELTVKRRKGKDMPCTKSFRIALSREITNKIEGLVKNRKITLAAFLYSAWGILLQKYCTSGDVVFGTTVSGRSAKIEKIEEIVGLFINTVPLRIQSHPDEKIPVLLSRINQALQKRDAYESTPLFNIKEYSELSTGESLFDSIIVIENYPLDNRLNPGDSKIVIHSYSMWEASNYDVTVGISTAGPIIVEVIYDNEIFPGETIERLVYHYRNIMENMVKHPPGALQHIDMLSYEEKRRLLKDFNDIGIAYRKDKTIQGLFAGQAERTPDHMALVAPGSEIPNKGTFFGGIHLTYKELNEKSRQLAGYLLQRGVKPGDLVGIMVKRTPGMIVGILGILNSGCAYVPLNPKAPEERIKYMLTDSGAKILLTGREIADIKPSSPLPFYPSNPLNLAYIIYTSGSTGKPKGVPITHANFSPLLHWGHHVLAFDSSDRVVQNLSYYFDWSVWEIFMALTSGASLYMILEEILLNAGQYVEFMNRHHITALHITPTQFQALVHWRERLNTLEYLCIGAEKLSADQAGRSYRLIQPNCRVFNMYGPTEATIISAVLEIYPDKLEDYRRLTSVPIGKTVGNTFLLVLDRDLNLCPIQVTGELYIGGDGLADGYLNNPELTAEKFRHDLWGYQDGFHRSYRSHMSYISYRSYYKTGDRVRWLPEGTIEFLGRIDFQLKIRGYRIEPGEIEHYLLEHKEVKEALVTARESAGGEKHLCAYIVPGAAHIDVSRLKKYLSMRLPDYMIPAYFIMLAQMPLNPNGKVDIKALPAPDITPAEGYTAPANNTEEVLAAIWSEVLGLEKEKIGVLDDFFQLGGHSLKAAGVIARVHRAFNMQIPLSTIFEFPSIREFALSLESVEESLYRAVAPVEEKEYYPLSSVQKRLFVLQQMAPGQTAYNVSGIMQLEGNLERGVLDRCFRQLISRHESLRTSFSLKNDEPMQKIHDAVEFEIEYYGAERMAQSAKQKAQSIEQDKERCAPGAVRCASFIRPFDLSRAPLLRVGLIKLLHTPAALRGHPRRGTYSSQEGKKHKYLLKVDMHHIISDGVSIELLLQDFAALVKGEALPRLKIRYRDYAQWQVRQAEKGKPPGQAAFWQEVFKDEIPVLQLPADYPRPAARSFAGDTLDFELTEDHTRALNRMALENKTTLFMTLLAVYTLFLSKLTNQEDIVVGTPVAGRNHPDLEQVMGAFVNTLGLRNYPGGEQTFTAFLGDVKKRTLKAFEHQDYPYEDLVETLLSDYRETSRNPLFDSMFVLQNPGIWEMEIPGLKRTPYPHRQKTSKFDLTLQAQEVKGKLMLNFEYCTKLFKHETIERFSIYFKEIVQAVLANPGKKLSRLEILPPGERRKIIEEFNHAPGQYPPGTAARFFTGQSARSPHHGACFDSGNYITYEELDRRSDVLAKLIKEL